jgi:hypothetical protein
MLSVVVFRVYILFSTFTPVYLSLAAPKNIWQCFGAKLENHFLVEKIEEKF